MKKVAIYVRVSTTNQAEEGYSVSEQIDKLTKYCEIKNWEVYDTYVDPGFTGSNTDRPGLQKLIRVAENKRIDTVLIYKLDRLSRSQKDTLYLIEDIFMANGIDFVSLSENIDTSTAFGRAAIGILSVFAQLEREQTAERMKMGKLGRAKSGKAMAWANDPFGYVYADGTYKIINHEATIVRYVFDAYYNGKSITKIRDSLNEMGYTGKNVKWSYRTVRGILNNSVYAGYNQFKGKTYKGNHEPIIPKKLYDDIQNELVKRQKQVYKNNNNPRPFQAKYMLSGIVRCGYCGAPLSSTLGNRRKDGSRLKKYQCYNRQPKRMRATIYNDGKQCESGFYHMNEIEEAVLKEVAKMLLDPHAISDSTEKNIPHNPTEGYEKRINLLDKRLEKLSDLYLNDMISLDDMKSKASSLRKEKKQLESTLDGIEEPKQNETLNFFKNNEINIYNENYEEQKRIVNIAIEKIDVTAEKTTVHWAF